MLPATSWKIASSSCTALAPVHAQAVAGRPSIQEDPDEARRHDMGCMRWQQPCVPVCQSRVDDLLPH